MRNKLLVGMSALSLLAAAPVLAQAPVAAGPEQSTTAAASPSIRPIPNSDMMYKKSVWRALDLREKQNKPMFSRGREITKIMIDAVKRGELTAYRNDSLGRTLALPEFKEALTPKDSGPQLSEEEKALGFTAEESSGFEDANAPAAPKAVIDNEFFANQLYQLKLKEDVIFDKKRSRMYHQIQSITLMLPAALTPKGIDLEIATFKYSDLVKVFRNNPEQAIWFNRDNDAQHKNLADAFDLWLFSSFIYKVSNPDDKQLTDLYGEGQKGILAAQQVAGDMIEYEYNLWSF